MAVGICVISVLGIFFGDLWIKNRIEKTGGENFPACFAGKKLILKKYHNTGAMLDLGSSKRALVAAVSVILTILISIAFALSLGRHGNNALRAGLTLLLGGSFSNTYDRLKRKYVVDYLSFNVKWKWLRNIVFNLSDFCIIIGSLLTALALSK
ncbi:MAG: signal peptidase II [Blautia sp.]|nr:signal peptidase II [Blautia sp.]